VFNNPLDPTADLFSAIGPAFNAAGCVSNYRPDISRFSPEQLERELLLGFAWQGFQSLPYASLAATARLLSSVMVLSYYWHQLSPKKVRCQGVDDFNGGIINFLSEIFEPA
jgi:hypothetical protein